MKATLEIEINKDWIDLCVKHSDLFASTAIGGWAFGVEPNKKIGWLILDIEAGPEDWQIDEETQHQALHAWRRGAKLPPNYYVINKEVAIKAFLEGVKLWGADWYNDGKTDGLRYNVVIQRALFGEVRYV